MKIAILRANALGDLIVALPALTALRNHFSEAHITLVGTHMHQQLAPLIPVDEVIPVSLPLDNHDSDFQHSMQRRKLDLAIQMHGGGAQSNPFIRQWEAKEAVGFRAPGAPDLDRTIPYPLFQHEVLRFLELAQFLGAEGRGTSVQVRTAGSRTGPIVIHPGASDPRRCWLPEKFAALVKGLDRECVIIGNADEKEVCRSIAAQTNAQDLSGRLSLADLVNLIHEAPLLVGNDSGPRHLAEALGTPSVGIFWIGNLINAGPLFRTFHRAHISWRLSCPTCEAPALLEDGTGMPRCAHNDSFVADISIEAILTDALELLLEVR